VHSSALGLTDEKRIILLRRSLIFMAYYALFYRSEEPVDINYADRKTSLKLNVNEFGQVSIAE